MQSSKSNVKTWLFKIRTVASWLSIFAFISLFTAGYILSTKYGETRWREIENRPRLLEWLLLWRNYSLILALLSGIISLPRWQSLVGLSLTILYTYFAVTSY